VAVPLDGSAADDPAAIRVLVSGSDFYAYPTPSPDGTRLAWICWDHPRMPWDGTELRVVALDGDVPVSDKSQQQLIMGCATESVLAPVCATTAACTRSPTGPDGGTSTWLTCSPSRGLCARGRRSSPPRCGSWA
jgi:hypothetical protein